MKPTTKKTLFFFFFVQRMRFKNITPIQQNLLYTHCRTFFFGWYDGNLFSHLTLAMTKVPWKKLQTIKLNPCISGTVYCTGLLAESLNCACLRTLNWRIAIKNSRPGKYWWDLANKKVFSSYVNNRIQWGFFFCWLPRLGLITIPVLCYC